jgi:hypothetical protein
MKKGSITLLVAIFTLCTPALAFDNIEADAAYERPIKDKIQTEFNRGLIMLKAQADRLNMEVREKDVNALGKYMYSKAIMMGRCVDRGVTLQKTFSNYTKVALDKYVAGCIEAHMKFMNWVTNTSKQVVSGIESSQFGYCINRATFRQGYYENRP